MAGITRKEIIRYTLLPEIKPRFRELIASGFHHVPYFMALVYQIVRLLPANHPYLNPANVGKYGIRHVIAEAANNLVISSKNIDQILLFVTILLGLTIIFVQISLLALSIMFQPALAAMPTNFAGFFLTANPAQDLAFIFLDLVFGVPDLFGSCVNPSVGVCLDTEGLPMADEGGAWILQSLGDLPYPIHNGLHQMFQMYSLGLLVVATLITLYFIVTIIAETAQSGTPFGRRFNKVWAPIRIVVAFGLLIPIGYGMNSSQWIVLYAAKFGSSFATNGWAIFNETLTDTYLGQTQSLVSQPNIPEIGGLLQFMYVARTCTQFENLKNQTNMAMYVVREPRAVPSTLLAGGLTLNPSNPVVITPYEDMINFANGASKITIRIGVKDEEDYPAQKGNVKPLCGEIIMPLTDPRVPGSANPPAQGAEIMQRYYWYLIQELFWLVFTTQPPNPPDNDSLVDYIGDNFPLNTASYYLNVLPAILGGGGSQTLPDPLPPPEYKSDLQTFYKTDIRNAMLNPNATGLVPVLGSDGALIAQINAGEWDVDPVLLDKGWAGAGIWYNKIAEMNGAVTSAVLNIPVVSRYPDVMEYVRLKKQQQDQKVDVDTRYEPILANGQNVPPRRPEDIMLAHALWKGFEYWQKGGGVTTAHTAPTGNAFIDAVNALLGTEGLYSMRRNPGVHPLAQLVGVGRSLVESSIRNLVGAGATSAAGVFLKVIGDSPGEVASVGVGFFMTVAMIGLTVGFVLFYIIPFLPFIYFFFAVGGWVKGIFEAMLGAPLWALAHIRIDGNGLPGQAAVSGYFLIFEIFVRPILIVFGFLASISIFSALVATLNEIWDLVLSNLAGFDVQAEVELQVEAVDPDTGLATEFTVPPSENFFRNAIDEFFFTVLYTIIVYMMGMSSFKLVDLIPNNILRWMGQSVQTFNDSNEDPVQGLVGTAQIGSQQAVSAIGGGMKGGLQSIAKGGAKPPAPG